MNGYATNSIRATDIPAASPQAPVPSALNEAENNAARLHDRISLLEQRLNSVLSALPPAGVNETAKMARHSLALQIVAQASDIGLAADRIDSIISRLEL